MFCFSVGGYGFTIYKSQAGQIVPDRASNNMSSSRAKAFECAITYDVTSEVVKQIASQM